MASVPHPLPSRMAHTVAALYGVEDDTLVAWQRFCAQTAEALRQQHDAERLSKALALAQGGAVEVDDSGFAVVTSGTKLYHVQADGSCDCPDFAHRRTPCKHGLAVLIHTRAQALAAPSPVPAAVSPKPARPATPRHSAAWDVHEAPLSTCLKLRLGPCEWTHTVRASDEPELQARFQAFRTLVHDMAAELNELALHLEASHRMLREALERQRAETPATPPPTALPQGDLQALLQQALQQALATANGHAASSTPPPAPPRPSTAPSAPEPDDQQTGFCSIHQVPMEQKSNDRGTWYSHWLRGEQQHCKGRRSGRR